ncbi:MAG TPA: ABC transporter permease [Deltaproteobacteria bacterium]|nr:ABC transporter permease [Deltaproteobacteria bacterium]
MDVQDKIQRTHGSISLSRPAENTLLIELRGSWEIGGKTPSALDVQEQFNADRTISRIIFDSQRLISWDSTLLTFLIRIIDMSSLSAVSVEKDGLPEGVQRLLSLAYRNLDRKEALAMASTDSFLHRMGDVTLRITRSSTEMLNFIKEACTAFFRLSMSKARFRRSDLSQFIWECGVQALAIVSLISVLVGIIVAFVGVVQLRIFGAEIYIANVVAIAMAREMGALMTAIIMMGRTGAAYAAQLGTMEVNEEIDAFKTLGISPMEFLVMPRILALVLMMPLLCIYSDIVGILGGAIISIGMFELPVTQYYDQTLRALNLTHLSIGIIKSAVFAVLIALSGCFYGMHCGRSASAVGDAATSSVVTGIVLIVIADGIFAVLTNALRI